MDTFWKTAGMVLITLILTLSLNKAEKDISLVLTITACCIVGMTVISYLNPVIELLYEFQSIGKMQDGMLSVLLRVAGAAIISELVSMLCIDAGNASLGKIFLLLGSSVCLSLSIPVIRGVIVIIQDILGLV